LGQKKGGRNAFFSEKGETIKGGKRHRNTGGSGVKGYHKREEKALTNTEGLPKGMWGRRGTKKKIKKVSQKKRCKPERGNYGPWCPPSGGNSRGIVLGKKILEKQKPGGLGEVLVEKFISARLGEGK